MIGAPLAAAISHYTPQTSDNVIKTTITEYQINGQLLTYSVPLNNINSEDLSLPIGKGLKKALIHLTAGPDNTVYPYLITPKGDVPSNHLKGHGFFINGDIINASETSYHIRYNNEKIALPQAMIDQILMIDNAPLNAIWHVRANGTPRFAGLEIDGDFIPYQFSLNSALAGLTQ